MKWPPFKFWFRLYYLIAISIGTTIGYLNWGGLIGAAGGAFLGVLIGTALFYSFTIIIVSIPKRKPPPDNE